MLTWPKNTFIYQLAMWKNRHNIAFTVMWPFPCAFSFFKRTCEKKNHHTKYSYWYFWDKYLSNKSCFMSLLIKQEQLLPSSLSWEISGDFTNLKPMYRGKNFVPYLYINIWPACKPILPELIHDSTPLPYF